MQLESVLSYNYIIYMNIFFKLYNFQTMPRAHPTKCSC